ncbi:1,3-beta-galactosyl-N-acetylhexosamine phosphorylase [Eubacteriales bacterium OttesenSCG-928-A19]|nr:1,3-beta-galactosyl-N-acetylhexosamine phosphorylase [Eubacteriales bacterium OttesenSCG-928-A19]
MKGRFTLPGEAGYEALTLSLAKRWGADVIRDSDGTKLSPELLGAGYDIYSTICLIRSVNNWAREHQDMLQQNLLLSFPVIATDEAVHIELLSGYSRDQFRVNDQDGMEFWQVFDRTMGEVMPREAWTYEDGIVTVTNAKRWHRYTVSFFAYRLWEVISMYNHITNDWGDRERLMPVEPRYPEVRRVLLDWLEQWCAEHPDTNVVRFTSMFYNFAWIWSDDPRARDVFSDWSAYDFSVSPVSLRAFREESGIDLTAEDFLRGGLRAPGHNAPTENQRRWMMFTHAFVAEFGRQCVEVVHRHGKKAYVFYDDTWIGVEPYGPAFERFGLDGVIKCVFNGFETRLCADVPHVRTREIRLHPYLFPAGLRGEPTFAPGGNPTPDLLRYWAQVRRALLRKPVDRIGMGGYLHLVEPFPEFISAVAEVADAFRDIVALHETAAPQTMPLTVGVLTAWGDLRRWSTSGHLHEHPEIDLTNLLETLSGLPVEVVFLDFDQIRAEGVPGDISVLLNAGWAGSAWSGGDAWRDALVIEHVTEWVMRGGGLLGVGEPTAPSCGEGFALGDLFGVGRDDGSRKCLRKYPLPMAAPHFLTADGTRGLEPLAGVYVDAPDTEVLTHDGRTPMLTARRAGTGRAVYLSGYRFSMEAVRLAFRASVYAAGQEAAIDAYITSNPLTEMARFGEMLVVNNNAPEEQAVRLGGESIVIPGYGMIVR